MVPVLVQRFSVIRDLDRRFVVSQD
jgi:hypothetical protein